MAELWALLLADVVATVITWFFGLVFRNVSVYDPYWSAASWSASPATPSTGSRRGC